MWQEYAFCDDIQAILESIFVRVVGFFMFRFSCIYRMLMVFL